MISAAANGVDASTSTTQSSLVSSTLGSYAFYNQECIIGLLACLVKQQPENLDGEELGPDVPNLVKFVLQMLKSSEVFESDVCIMFVNVLTMLLLKCEPAVCNRIADELSLSTNKQSEKEVNISLNSQSSQK